MRAIILAAGDGSAIAPLNDHYPPALLPLVDRPFLQHVIEALAGQGVRRFDLVLSHLPERIEHHLGDGKRWGCTFTYHLARDPSRPYRLLRALHLEGDSDGPILLGHGDRLPQLDLGAAALAAGDALPALFYHQDETDPGPAGRRWTGWALLTPADVARFPADPDERELEAHLRPVAADERSWLRVPRTLSVASFRDLLAAQEAVLAKDFPGLLLTGAEAEPGIRLSRNVQLHPTAGYVPPVFIGENCSVGAGARLGPGTVVGRDCMLDEHCTVTHSVIFPGSYVGPGLELADALVDKNRLINVRLDSAVNVKDGLIRPLDEDSFRAGARRLLSRVAALMLLVPACPVLLLTLLFLKLLRRGPVCHPREGVRLPAPEEPRGWRTFRLLSFLPGPAPAGVPLGMRGLLLGFLPGLVHVASGKLSFAGLPPRTREEVEHLPHDWRVLYLRGKAGLVTEAAVCHGPGADEDERYAADTFYVASAGWKYDLKLLLLYFTRSLLGPRRTPAPAAAEDVELS
jgi:NDP-sugar pyrophosphorylase family protein